jgi:hypothetical protein
MSVQDWTCSKCGTQHNTGLCPPYFTPVPASNEALLERCRILELQLSEARVALEIASPSMVHTFSGHVYEDGKPVEWVEGCAKCRIMKILGAAEKKA